MRKCLLTLGLVFVSFAALAWPWDDKINDYKRDEVAFARKGSLGSDSFVVTNVVPSLPAYSLQERESTNLVDRAINRYTLIEDVSFVLPPAPQRRATDDYRSARGFVLLATVTTDSPPSISFIGAKKIVSDDWTNKIKLLKGENLISFMEINDGVFLIETAQLTEIQN